MSHDRRYQVFVSSTYQDLRRERQVVLQALLEMKCIPVGMELFPAANEQQWSLIKREIDQCDYYVLILGGRYGSTAPDGVGYTEKEYRYALEIKKPVIAFVHKDPDSLASRRVEQSDEGRKKYLLFRQLVQQRLIKQWSTASDLGQKVTSSLVKLIETQPAPGWMRGDGNGQGYGKLYTINDCLLDILQVISACKDDDTISIRHLGLDMSVACDYIGKMLRGCKAKKADYNILVMPERKEELGPNPPEEVTLWSTYVPASIRRIQKHVTDFVKGSNGSRQEINVQIRQYSGVPLFHGVVLRGGASISYVSVCGFRGADYATYDWGELAYRRVVPGQATASDQHLADTMDGLISNYWNYRSNPRWNFQAIGSEVRQNAAS